MADVKIVRWNSELGKLSKDTPPARLHMFDTAKMQYAAQTLGQLAEFLKPFIPRLKANKGEATIAVQIAYVETGTAPPAQTDNLKAVIAELEQQLDFAKEFPDPYPWRPTEGVRNSMDLPCPKCKAPAGQRCGEGADIHTSGNGIDKDQKVMIHDERARLTVAYAELSQ